MNQHTLLITPSYFYKESNKGFQWLKNHSLWTVCCNNYKRISLSWENTNSVKCEVEFTKMYFNCCWRKYVWSRKRQILTILKACKNIRYLSLYVFILLFISKYFPPNIWTDYVIKWTVSLWIYFNFVSSSLIFLCVTDRNWIFWSILLDGVMIT